MKKDLKQLCARNNLELYESFGQKASSYAVQLEGRIVMKCATTSEKAAEYLYHALKNRGVR